MQEAGWNTQDALPEVMLYLEHPRTEFKHSLYQELSRQLEALGFQLRERYYRRTDQVLNSQWPYLVLCSKKLEFPGPGDIISTLFASDSAQNLCRYRSSDLDLLLEEAELEKSWNERNKIFFSIQDILNSDMPAVPLFSQQNQVAVQPFVRGIRRPPLGFYHLKMRKVYFER